MQRPSQIDSHSIKNFCLTKKTGILNLQYAMSTRPFVFDLEHQETYDCSTGASRFYYEQNRMEGMLRIPVISCEDKGDFDADVGQPMMKYRVTE